MATNIIKATTKAITVEDLEKADKLLKTLSSFSPYIKEYTLLHESWQKLSDIHNFADKKDYLNLLDLAEKHPFLQESKKYTSAITTIKDKITHMNNIMHEVDFKHALKELSHIVHLPKFQVEVKEIFSKYFRDIFTAKLKQKQLKRDTVLQIIPRYLNVFGMDEHFEQIVKKTNVVLEEGILYSQVDVVANIYYVSDYENMFELLEQA
jgi:hypothetical protein